MLHKISIIAILGVALSACGGSSSGSGGNKSGQFKDSNTSGLTFSFGDQSGVTEQDGSFEYQEDQPVAFSVGGVELGSASGQPILTPIDVIAGGSSEATDVQNAVRFLLMLDKDGNPENGIEISSAVQDVAENWSQVNFLSSSFESDVATFQSEAASVDGTAHELPTAQEAQDHLEKTFRCSYSGAYKGRYKGTDSGSFGFLVNAADGLVIGVAYSDLADEIITLDGSVPVSVDRDRSFVSGGASSGATFNGSFTDVNRVSGTWSNQTENGSYSGARIGGDQDARYRYTGGFRGDDFGLFAFDVNATGRVTGVAYSVTEDVVQKLSGSLSGSSLNVQVSSGAQASGTLNLVTGELTGTWSNSAEGDSGDFGGSGCKLN